MTSKRSGAVGERGGTSSVPRRVVPVELDGETLVVVVRRLFGTSGKRAKRWLREGRVTVDGAPCRAGARLASGAVVALAPPRSRPRLEPHRIVYLDGDLVVVDKPAGLSTVPSEKGEGGALVDVLRRHLATVDPAGPRRGAQPAVYVVQRLDRGTSGVIVLARSRLAADRLRSQLRAHSAERLYRAVAHGAVGSQTYRSHLVPDRGDGRRGSWEGSLSPTVRRARGGKLAVTHVELLEALEGATLLRCRLETGRTNQIRIHMSEDGHPLVGEGVYLKGYAGPVIAAPRLMLHAATLAFEHPRSGEALRFEVPPPPDFEGVVSSLRPPRP